MKTLKELEDITLAELQEASDDPSVPVPEGLRERLAETVGTLSVAENLEERRPLPARWRVAGIAAALAVLIGTGALLLRPTRPADTYDDPMLAYAEVQRAFNEMAVRMNKGLEQTAAVQEMLGAPERIINGNK